jgi:SAM-dependent methyltransferase
MDAVAEAKAESGLKAGLPCLTPLADGVSAAVAGQYEENPYPRWLSLTVPEPGSALPPGIPPDAEVLVAGCGTGRQAVRAGFAYGPAARVTAIDLSRASLAYGMRLARRYGLGNVDFAQADILGLAEWERRFDVIECTGVLHHMADPLEGWRVLAHLLRPGGVMQVALYSRRARIAVTQARARIAAEGLSPGDPDIRRFRRAVMEEGGALAELAASAADFASLSGTRDLLFHVQEHQFSIPEIAQCLASLGLDFVAMRQPGPAELLAWDEIERRQPDLFQGMIDFTCSKRAL